ncbi:MAG: T9SS type A sorting domain-containing protein [Bacteroidetes bacterium]|nr:T9SS type A sorting domain-containing protein [Bacteroidota bacterium]
MKRFYFGFCLTALFLFAGIINSKGQSGFESSSKTLRTGRSIKDTMVLYKDGNRKSGDIVSPNFTGESLSSVMSAKAVDTLHFPLAGDSALYYSDENGFVTGNNEFGDLAKAEFFQSFQDYEVTGILVGFAFAVGGNPEIEIALWDNTGTGNSPGVKKGSATVDLNTIKTDITDQQMTFIEFNPPVLLTTSFYAGFILPTTIGDTLAVWSNTDGDTNPGTAWELWSSDEWYPMSSNQSWGLDLSQAIFPVIIYDETMIVQFSANDVSIEPGQSVIFQDTSAGIPDSWQWIFEGGVPATSGDQNPVVTYNDPGGYDVTLIAGNDYDSDTLVKQDYITVEASTVQTDTLNYPLEGTYAVYWSSEVGFISGNNVYGDMAKANFFTNGQNRYITGILVEFAYATGGNPDIEIAVWNQSITNGSPGTKIASKTIPLNTIKNDIVNEAMTYISVDPPVNVTSSFFAGVMLPTVTGDTLVIWSNMDGDTDPGIAWEMWDNGTWYSFSETTNSWGINVALAIYPIVQNSLGVADKLQANSTKVFPNPSSGVFRFGYSSVNHETVINIFSPDGLKVLEKNFDPGENIFLDLSNHQPGIYIAEIRTGDKVSYLKLILE